MEKIINNFIIPNKINMIIDGQFGSTGKGLISAKIANDEHIDLSIARLSPNAGHTFYINDNKYISKMIPVSAIMQPHSTIYISAGSVIDIDTLQKEIKLFDIDPDRIVIHPRAAVVTEQDMILEQESGGIEKIASTQSGSGAARSSKIMRTNPLVQGVPSLNKYIKDQDYLHYLLQQEGISVFCETGQGFDLSINHGYSYPYCTSIDVTPSAVLADLGLHPSYLGNVMLSMRTYPIRVGNKISSDGSLIGYSGDVYSDSKETSFECLEQEIELTTVTKKPRRIFTFSREQYERVLMYIQPTHVFMNFINYLSLQDLELFLSIREPDYVGYGKYTEQVNHYDKNTLINYLTKIK